MSVQPDTTSSPFPCNKIETTVDVLIDLAPYFSITRHKQGRVTLKISLSGLTRVLDLSSRGVELVFPGIVDTSVSKWARTITIDYDTGIIPPAMWERLAHCDRDREEREAVRKDLLDIGTTSV